MNKNDYRKMELQELQVLILKTMKYLHSFCEANGIQYYIIAGTVLGAVRHGGFIPWDDDIDIAMTRDNYEKFRQIFKQKGDRALFLQDHKSDKDFGLALMRVCIKGTYLDWPEQNHLRNCKNAYIDIFPLDNVPDVENEQAKQARDMSYLNKICNLKLYKVGETRSIAIKILKHVLHTMLKVVPINFLVRLKIAVMTRCKNNKSDYLCSMQSHYSYKKQMIKRSIYGNPTLINFEDTKFYAPEHYKEYLSHLYGDYMKLPPVEKRPKTLDAYINKNYDKGFFD